MERPIPISQPVAFSRRRALSPLLRLVKILRGEEETGIEILPPDDSRGNMVALARTEHSAEARADAFASLFLNATPRDLRDPRSGPR